MADLVSWLREQIEADRTSVTLSDGPCLGERCDAYGVSQDQLLAECDAKLAIIELHTGEAEVCIDPNWEDEDLYTAPCPTLKLLAVPYSDRPGYREEWRPE